MSTINIRESLRQLDDDSFCKYDLLTMYDSCPLLDEDKQEIAKLLYNKEDPEVIYQKLCTYFCDDDTSEIDSFNDFVQPGTFEVIVNECVNKLKESCSDAQYNDVANQLEVIKDGELYTTGLAPIEIETGDIKIFVDGNYDSPLAFDSIEDAVNYVTDVVLNKLTSTSVDSGDDDVMVYTVYDIVEDDDNRLTAKCMNESTNDFHDIKLGKVNSQKVNELLNNMLNNPNYKITDEVKKKIYDKSAPWGLAVQMTSAVDVDGTNGLLSTGDFGGEASFGESIETNFEKEDRVTDGSREGTVLDSDSQKVLVEWDYSETDDIEWVDKSDLSFVECLKESEIPMNTAMKDIQSYLNYHLGSNEDYIKVTNVTNIDKNTVAAEYEVHLSIPTGNDEYENDTEYRSLPFRYKEGKWQPVVTESMYDVKTKTTARKLVDKPKVDGKKLSMKDAEEIVDQSYNDKADNIDDFYKSLDLDESHEDDIEPNLPTFNELRKQYRNYITFKNKEKNSGLIRDLCDQLENKKVSYDIYNHKKDDGMTIFYDDCKLVEDSNEEKPYTYRQVNESKSLLDESVAEDLNRYEFLVKRYDREEDREAVTAISLEDAEDQLNSDGYVEYWDYLPDFNYDKVVNESSTQASNIGQPESESLKESVNSDIVSMIKKQFPKATIKTSVRKHSNVHKSNPDTPRGKSKYVDIRITPDSVSSVNSILQYCNHNLKKILDSDNRFYHYGDTPARNPRGSKEVILSYEDYSDLSGDEYNSMLGESKSIKEGLKEEFKKQLQDELYDKFIDLARTPEWGFEDEKEIEDFLMPVIEVKDYKGEYDNDFVAEIRGEFTYDELEDIASSLDPIVQKYDKGAYFEPVTSGIIRAYINIDNKIMENLSSTTEKYDRDRDYLRFIRRLKKANTSEEVREISNDIDNSGVAIEDEHDYISLQHSVMNRLKELGMNESVEDAYTEAAEHLMDVIYNEISAEVIDYYIDNFGSSFIITYNNSLDNIRNEAINLSDILTKNGYKVRDWDTNGNNVVILRFAKPISLNEGIKDDDELISAEQEFDSAATSINSNKLPAVYSMVRFNPGDVVVDFGGGKFDNAVNYLKDQDVTLLVYDPYNRSVEHNKEVLKVLREHGGADSAVNSNVLNVIKEPEARNAVLQNIKKITKKGAPIYITVYEGTGKGNEGPTKSGYQLNRKTADYINEISQVFSNVKRKGKLITAINESIIDNRLGPNSARYKDYRISLLTDGSGYAIFDKHGEMEDHGFKSIKDAKSAIDEFNSIYKPVLSKGLSEASYGGAFDIEDNQYFTREDIIDFGNKVCEILGEIYPDTFDISDTYIHDNNILFLEVTSKQGNEGSANFKIDMRKIRKPSDLLRFADEMAFYLRQDLEELYTDNSIFTESASDWRYVASKRVPDSDGFLTDYTWYENTKDGRHIFIFGDNDLYDDVDSNYADWETDSYSEARSWFNNYHGFDEEDM